MDKITNKYWTFCISLALVLITFAVFWQLHAHDFVHYDDDQYVTENHHVKAGLTGRSIKWALTASHAGNWHPLTWLSHMLDCQLFGLNPRWHHMTNLLLHIANTLLLFLILKSMTGTLGASAFVAAVFALHPVHVESVAWVAERKDVLSGLFWMLTMAAYLRYLRGRSLTWYLLMLLAFALGLMAKPMLVTLPFVLLLLDYWPLGRFQPVKEFKNPRRRKRKSSPAGSQSRFPYRLILEKLPLFALSITSCIATFLAERSGGTVARVGLLPLNIRIANAFISYVKYIGKMLWPNRLAVFYPLHDKTLPMWHGAVAALLLLAVSILVIRLGLKRRYLLVGWLWYLGTLVPVIGLVQVGAQALADRYTYLSSIGIFIIVAWAVTDITAKWPYRKIALGALSLIVLLLLSICTWFQQQYWRNSLTLFERTLAVTTDNCKMHNNFGLELQLYGRLDEAVGHFRHALRIKPDYMNARNNLGRILQAQGKLGEAIGCFSYVLQLSPSNPDALSNLGNALHAQGKSDEAVNYFRQALAVEPSHVKAHNNLGIILQSQRKLNEAAAHFRQALQFRPDYAEAHNNLAITMAMQGKLDQAISHCRRAVQLKPHYFEAYYNMANALRLQGKLDQAVSHFRHTLKLNPDFPEAHYSLAKILQAQGKFDEAISHLLQALQINPNHIKARQALQTLLKKSKPWDIDN